MLTTADLAAREDFTLGGVIVSPSTRSLRGPGGNTDVEPRVMQVLVSLAESAGQVVTRETLFNRCWGGVYVGDDSLNRAVAAVRRAAATVGGRFEIETIPRTGYRLVVPKGDHADPAPDGEYRSRFLSRRQLAIGAGAVTILGAGGLWWQLRSGNEERFDALLERANALMRHSAAFGDARSVRLLEQAVAIRPGSARAWGLLGLAGSMAAQSAAPAEAAGLNQGAQDAARKALAIDPREPNALLAMYELEGSTLGWLVRDRTLRRIITIDPRNVIAITELVALLQAVGLSRESWSFNERALVIEPLSPDLLSRRAMKLWILGRTPEADKVIDQVRGLYPSNTFAEWARFVILALSGRAKAAQAILASDAALIGRPPTVTLWRECLPALDAPTPTTLAKARQACLAAAPLAGQLAIQSVMILSALREVDRAFDVANGFLLWRGSIVRRGPAAAQTMNDAAWRTGVQWLFTPACVAMRADPRFLPLCDGIGLVEYWRNRGVKPDYLLTNS